jgi:hypothetical protein
MPPKNQNYKPFKPRKPMSTLIDKINDMLYDKRKPPVMVIRIDPDSNNYHDMKWLIDNQKKIIANRKLIDLIG